MLSRKIIQFQKLGILLIIAGYFAKGGECAEIGPANCSDDAVMACAYPLKADQLRFTSTKEDLSALCPDLHKGLRCIDNYTRNCMEPKQRSHFNHLYSGSSMVIHEICTEGPLQDEFLRHAPCMNKVRDDYEICANQYQDRINFIKKDMKFADKEENVEKICCSLQEYLRCSKDMVKKSCGEETAKFASGFLDKMSNSLIVEHCEKLSLFEETCRSSASNFHHRLSITYLMPFIFTIIILMLSS